MEKNDAAEQFYHTYRSLIFRTAARLCRTQEDLDDLIQDFEEALSGAGVK